MTRALRTTTIAVAALGTAVALGAGGDGAAEVSFDIRPTVSSGFALVTAFGQTAEAGPGQKVTVQFKQCGLYPQMFRDAEEVTTTAGGGFTAQLNVDANGVFRALVGKDVSNEVPVRARATVRLETTRFGSFRASVVAKLSFWHRKIAIERFDPRPRKWVKAKTVLIEESHTAGEYIWSMTDPFKLPGRKSTTYRATLSRSQAKPCYLAGTSAAIRK